MTSRVCPVLLALMVAVAATVSAGGEFGRLAPGQTIDVT